MGVGLSGVRAGLRASAVRKAPGAAGMGVRLRTAGEGLGEQRFRLGPQWAPWGPRRQGACWPSCLLLLPAPEGP